MLAPHELKNTEFSKSLRGYSTIEVDEHIDFLIEKYTELYRENDELEKKLRLVEAQLDAMKDEEESIRATLVNAQKASTRIINEANEQADVIMRSAKNSCDKLIAELRANVKAENERLNAVKKEAAQFKAALFEAYKSHVEIIEQIAPGADLQINDSETDELSSVVINEIKESLSGKTRIISGSEVPFADDTDDEDVEEDLNDAEVSIPAEMPIPDEIYFEAEENTVSDIRDADSFSSEDNDSDEIVVERKFISDDSLGIKDSIRKLHSSLQDSENDDEEFLRMIKNVSEPSETVTTSEFEIVYDGKNKK